MKITEKTINTGTFKLRINIPCFFNLWTYSPEWLNLKSTFKKLWQISWVKQSVPRGTFLIKGTRSMGVLSILLMRKFLASLKAKPDEGWNQEEGKRVKNASGEEICSTRNNLRNRKKSSIVPCGKEFSFFSSFFNSPIRQFRQSFEKSN